MPITPAEARIAQIERDQPRVMQVCKEIDEILASGNRFYNLKMADTHSVIARIIEIYKDKGWQVTHESSYRDNFIRFVG